MTQPNASSVRAIRFPRTRAGRIGSAYRIAAGFLAASLAATAAAQPAALPITQEVPFPPNARPCVVVHGSAPLFGAGQLAGKPGEEQRLKRFQDQVVAASQRGTDLVTQALAARSVDVVQVFEDPRDAPRPPESSRAGIALLESANCAKIVFFASVYGDDANGPYFGYEVKVIRLVERFPTPTGILHRLGFMIDFARTYHRPQTQEELNAYDIPKNTQLVADDLIASGALPDIGGSTNPSGQEPRQAPGAGSVTAAPASASRQ